MSVADEIGGGLVDLVAPLTLAPACGFVLAGDASVSVLVAANVAVFLLVGQRLRRMTLTLGLTLSVAVLAFAAFASLVVLHGFAEFVSIPVNAASVPLRFIWLDCACAAAVALVHATVVSATGRVDAR